jgi:negative regulator of sigma E activity
VLLWVDKASGALMRMEGYDWDAKLIKRFEVVSAQKIERCWFLKQMRVEQFQPGTNHVEARAYLEIKR